VHCRAWEPSLERAAACGKLYGSHVAMGRVTFLKVLNNYLQIRAVCTCTDSAYLKVIISTSGKVTVPNST